ncbi:MAG: hypothetical protein AAF357_02190 [Verrucomicrobiota bacterium]
MYRLLAILLLLTFADVTADEPRHLLVAEFLLQRFEPANLTPAQRSEFNRLSGDLRTEIDQLRAEAGIDKAVMSRRDEAHQKLKVQKLEEEVYWTSLRAEANLSDSQLAAFRTTSERYEIFKSAATALLSDEQRKIVAEARRKAKEKAE